MEEASYKAKIKVNMCTYRRLNIQHEIDENLRKQIHSSNLHFFKYQEQLFNRKIAHLRRSLEPSSSDALNAEQSSMVPYCSTRIQNHFRYLNFSPETEKRLLYQAKSSKQLPNIFQKRNSTDRKTFQSYLNQRKFDEEQKQMKNDQRKMFLLREFDELKHTIDDPHSTLSVLAALSRAFLFFDSGTE